MIWRLLPQNPYYVSDTAIREKNVDEKMTCLPYMLESLRITA